VRRSATLISALVVLALPASALAHGKTKPKTIAPPGVSAVSQYVEVVPSAGGGRPSSTVHISQGGAVGRGSSPASGSSVSGSTVRAMNHLGRSGAAAAALAGATAPSSAARNGSSALDESRVATADAAGAPASALLKALTGSSAGGGLGLVLPLILVGSLLLAAAAALVKRRRTF